MKITLIILIAVFMLSAAALAIGIDWLVDKRFENFTEEDDT